ncbi:rhodanese-like domain-containing protein [Microbacterium sp. ASV81]|uniref:Rhodanese-like domain-containing protein n=1 Tax=Microbacterium capsulatum TaxID=3041921 RepID=A0ABU0XH75_9MICO|nr:rhodanese-like domain-containing protein [Microbacterium sp. ASV81]MDQ4214481.1 rhodanese-like domain-containing protein [Microbacterium sp. ASV81]
MPDLRARLAFVDALLDYQIDVVAASRVVAEGTAVLVDTRRQESWDHGHVLGALHLPSTAPDALPRDRTLLVYGWGPGCNGATVAARDLLAAGFDVREMIGGYEYWARNGFPVVRGGEVVRMTPDPLVTAETGPEKD